MAQGTPQATNPASVPGWGIYTSTRIDLRTTVLKGNVVPMRTIVLRYMGWKRVGTESVRVSFQSDPIDMDERLPELTNMELKPREFSIDFFVIKKVNGQIVSGIGTTLSAMNEDKTQERREAFKVWRVRLGESWRFSFDLNLELLQKEIQKVASHSSELQEVIVDTGLTRGSSAFRILLPTRDQLRLWEDLVQLGSVSTVENR